MRCKYLSKKNKIFISYCSGCCGVPSLSSSFMTGTLTLPVAMTVDGWRLIATWIPPPGGWLLAEERCLTQAHILFLGVGHIQRLEKLKIERSGPIASYLQLLRAIPAQKLSGGKPCGLCCDSIITSHSAQSCYFPFSNRGKSGKIFIIRFLHENIYFLGNLTWNPYWGFHDLI